MEKLCNKCGETKPYNQEYFSKHSRNKSGLSSNCKSCEKKYSKARRDRIKNNPITIKRESHHACNLCGLTKPYNTENFYRKASATSGLSSDCKSCQKVRDTARKKKIKKHHNDSGLERTRPINPQTNQPYKKGEMIGDKYVFGIRTGSWETEYPLILLTYDEFIRQNCNAQVNTKKKNYRLNGKWKVDEDMTADYLLEIFPKDMKCPIYDIEMTLVGHQQNSIELDRIDCTKGYKKGNVAWMSRKANRNKNDATSEELYKIADWLKKKGC